MAGGRRLRATGQPMGARDNTPIFLHRRGLDSTAAHHRSKRERTSLRWPRTDCDRDDDWQTQRRCSDWTEQRLDCG